MITGFIAGAIAMLIGVVLGAALSNIKTAEKGETVVNNHSDYN